MLEIGSPSCGNPAQFSAEHSVFITESLPVNREAEHVLLQKRKGTGELRVVLHLFQERLLGWNLALIFDFFYY